jgi:phosphate transport system substrate-binding protein
MHKTAKLTLGAVLAASAVLLSVSAEARELIQNKGSDTLVNVAQAWAEAYQEVNSDVAVAVSGGGSGTGIAAMINGTVDIANASRSMKQKEVDLAKSKGQDPIEHIVGFDALAVYLHQDNPAEFLSIPQLAEMYGEEGETETWTDIGIEVPGGSGDGPGQPPEQLRHLCLFPQGGSRQGAGLPHGDPRYARLEGRCRSGRENTLRHRL